MVLFGNESADGVDDDLTGLAQRLFVPKERLGIAMFRGLLVGGGGVVQAGKDAGYPQRHTRCDRKYVEVWWSNLNGLERHTGIGQHALGELRDEGVRLGLSTSGPRQADVIRAGLDLQVNGAPLFSSVQATWNLLETSSGTALWEAHEAGVSVVIKEVFANGRLAPGSTDTSPGVQKASRLAAELQIGLDQLAVAVALQQPWMPRVLSGAVTVSHVRSHLAGSEIALPPQLADELTGESEDPIRYWAARSQRDWS